MDGWTIISLPTIHLDKVQGRIDRIVDWATSNEIDTRTMGISARIVRFKHKETATFFRLSFNG